MYSIAGTMACMIWKGTPYYAHMEYNDKTDPEDCLPDEDVKTIDEIPVYSINKPKDESLAILKILSNEKIMKKNRFLEVAINVYPTSEQAIKEMIVVMYIAYVCMTDHQLTALNATKTSTGMLLKCYIQ